VCALVYSISPIHDDAFYAERAAKLAASAHVDSAYIKDPGGLLTPKRARTLIETAQRELKGKPLEMHCHCTIGLADLAYAEAAELGVVAVQCASGAASDGTSNPPSERVIANLTALGHTIDVDQSAVREISAFFTALARAEGLPEGKPAAFDAAYMRHQLPGGMVSTMRRHLAESRLDGIEQAVIEELGRVREELGWPIVMTPFSQILLAQAVINVTGHERYATVPDELIRYALGRFGRPNIPIDPNVMDRIRSLPRAKEIEAEGGPTPPEELRKRFKKGISDEEFLLRATMPEAQVDAMLAAGPAPRHYEPASRAAIEALRQATQSNARSVDIERPDFKLSLRRNAA
jgi:oxaloacetate decarboxylase alpha subunit